MCNKFRVRPFRMPWPAGTVAGTVWICTSCNLHVFVVVNNWLLETSTWDTEVHACFETTYFRFVVISIWAPFACASLKLLAKFRRSSYTTYADWKKVQEPPQSMTILIQNPNGVASFMHVLASKGHRQQWMVLENVIVQIRVNPAYGTGIQEGCALQFANGRIPGTVWESSSQS